MSALWEPLWSPAITTAETIPIAPFGPITETNLQDGLEEMTPMLYAAQVMAATLFGAL